MNRRPPLNRESATGPARERREKNRKRQDPLVIVRAVVLALVVAQVLRVVFTSPRMRLQHVRVTGTQRLTADDVVRMGSVPLGQNIFRVNLVHVSDRLHAAPVVRQAVATRELPDSLHVQVTERIPAMRVATVDGAFHADSEGVLFEAAPANPEQLPVLQLPDSHHSRIGEKLRPELVSSLFDCAKLAKKERISVRKVRVDEGGELWLNVEIAANSENGDGSLAVRLGRPSDLPEKFRDIRQTLASFPARMADAKYLDVMCAGRPALSVPERTSTH